MWVTNFTSDDPIFPHGSVNVTIQDQELEDTRQKN